VKKLLGMMAVVAMIAAPAMADPSTGTSAVQITVQSYCGLAVPPGTLTMSVNSVAYGATVSEGINQATTTFAMEGNAPYYVMVTPDATSASTSVVNGQAGGLGSPYPTAYTSGHSFGIGYGLSISGSNGLTSAGWGTSPSGDFTKIETAVAAGLTTATLKINSYLDSGRSTIQGYSGMLAPPGVYTGVLTITVSVTSL
jgi:hypothetical protein